MFSRTTETHGSIQQSVNTVRVCPSGPRLCVVVDTRLAGIALVLALIAMVGTAFAQDKEKAPDTPTTALAQVKKKKIPRKTETSLARGKKPPVKSAPGVAQGKEKETPVKFWTALAQGKTKTPVKSEAPLAKGKAKTTTRKTEPTLADRVAKAKAEVASAANTYKVSLEKLLALQEDDVKAASDNVERRKELLAQAIISKRELEESERSLSAAQDKVANTKRQMAESDTLIADATAEAELAKLGPGAYQATGAMIRYNGPAHWVLTDAAKVQGFFALKFNHALPISAFGQTAVHDHMGFDHRNSIDVALSPDSSEGQALMAYLRSAGIPFIAFRYAVPGSATGAHIHIGYPSHRIGK